MTLIDRFSPIQPPMLKPFDFIRKLTPAAHEFQIGLFGFRVLSSLRCNRAFYRLYSEPLRSRSHGS